MIAHSIMTTALNKGLAQGRAEGRVEGFAEGETKANRENARRMKTKGYPLEDIAEVTGLSPEEVENRAPQPQWIIRRSTSTPIVPLST